MGKKCTQLFKFSLNFFDEQVYFIIVVFESEYNCDILILFHDKFILYFFLLSCNLNQLHFFYLKTKFYILHCNKFNRLFPQFQGIFLLDVFNQLFLANYKHFCI